MNDRFGRKKTRDNTGRLKFYTQAAPDRDIVCDRTGRMLGFCRDDITCDAAGRRVLIGERPGYLVREDEDEGSEP